MILFNLGAGPGYVLTL